MQGEKENLDKSSKLFEQIMVVSIEAKLRCIARLKASNLSIHPETPELNGLVERVNRTIMERVRSMLSHAKLPK